MLVKSSLKSRINSGCSSVYPDVLVRFLKLSAVCVLLIAVLGMLPAAAEPLVAEGLPESEKDFLFESMNEGMGSNFLQKNQADAMLSVASAVRETKLRSSQKKFLSGSSNYYSSADTCGNVFFDQSPVVTSLHLPQGFSGQVILHPEAVSAGPKCCEVYSVFSLFGENYPRGEEAIIRYMMPRAEIEDRGSHPSDISLCFYDKDSWKKLPTEYYMEDDSVFFESVTTALGIFAVVLEECIFEVEPITLQSRHMEYAPVSLDVSPVGFLTHPMSYTVSVK